MIPIHDRLIELGLLNYVETLKQRGEKRLFPELTYSLKQGYGRKLGDWFNNVFLVELGIKSDRLVFHSFRHTVMTRLLQAGVEENKAKAIVGHARQGVAQKHYFKQSYTMKQLRDALALYEPDRDESGEA